MLTSKTKKYLINPIIGLLPFVVYIILQTYILPIPYAALVALLITGITECSLSRMLGSRIQGFTFYLTAVALMLIGLLWIMGNTWIEQKYSYVLIGEIAIILQLIGLKIGRRFFKAKYLKQKSFFEKILLTNFSHTAVVLKYALIIHVMTILVYKQLGIFKHYESVEHILYITAPITIILSLLIAQILRTKHLSNRLEQEEWLPIVNENGCVKGKIAKTVSKNMNNKYMHPIVRIALICNGKIFLQERQPDYILDPGKIDHPFEKYILFKHGITQAASNCIKRMLGKDLGREPQFLIKYTFENEVTKRLIFLFTITIDDESLLCRSGNMRGKFWTVKQIDQEFGDQIFGECFELEYEYLKHMILLNDADNLIAQDLSTEYCC